MKAGLTDVICVGHDNMKDRATVEIGKAATRTHCVNDTVRNHAIK